MMKFFLVLLFTLLSCDLYAGYYELGFSGNYRKIYLPTNENRESFDETVAYTASFAYYFAEMAAAELSYTKGKSERFVPSQVADSRTTYDYSLIGLDLILTFAERQAPFVPYLKGGIAYFYQKEVTYEFTGQAPDTVTLPQTFVPSVGFGLKIRLTKTMALKIGMEAWTSALENNSERWDYAGRAGVSWFF